MSATIADVATEARVSVATVSRALRGLPNVAPETRARVLAAADALHYVVDPQASRLAEGRTRTVGVVVPRLGQWYYATVTDAVHAIVGAAGYDLLPFPLDSPDTRERFLDRLPYRKRVDGLVIVDVPMSDDHLQRMAEAHVPIVTVGMRTTAFSSLTVDNLRGARLATEHLVGLGHERIGLVGGHQPEPFDFVVPHERRAGFDQAMQERGLAINPAWVADAELTAAGGAAAMTAILHADERPTGVVAMSDEMAVGAIQVAADVGLRVPEDLSVVGFDDHELAEHLGLTTIRQDVAGQGRAAAGWILEAMVGRTDPHHEVIPTRLVVRRTTAPRR